MLTVIAIALGAIIICSECLRVRNHPVLDFLSFTSFIYFIVFVISPIFIDYSTYSGHTQSDLSWAMVNSLGHHSLVYAELLALTGYLLMLFGYCNSGSLVAALFDKTRIEALTIENDDIRVFSRNSLLLVGTLLGIVGTVSFLVYIVEIGGIVNLFKYAGALRSGDSPIETEYAFLKNVSPLVLASSFIFYALWKDFKSGWRGRIHGLLFIVSVVISLALLFHMAGRLRFFSYLMIFPTTAMLLKRRLRVGVVISGIVLSLFVITFGKQVSHILLDQDTFSRKMALIDSENYSLIVSIANEFAFPLANIANTVCYAVPFEIPYRYFVDFLLAFAYLLPKRLFLVDLPATANNLNGEQLGGPIPIDLISLGYYSAGVLGVVIIMLLFGICLRFAERIFAAGRESVIGVFRVAWMFFLGFRIMYGDPVNSLKVGFYLVIGSALLLLIRQRRVRMSENRLLLTT